MYMYMYMYTNDHISCHMHMWCSPMHLRKHAASSKDKLLHPMCPFKDNKSMSVCNTPIFICPEDCSPASIADKDFHSGL